MIGVSSRSAYVARRRPPWLLLVVWLAILLEGCGDQGPPPDAAAAIGEIVERQLTEVFRLGGVDAREDVAFQTEPSIAVHRSGLLFLSHGRQGRVAVLDSAGDFVRWIGRQGEGPGEFQVAAALGLVGDTLWIRNFPSPRISRFLTDGTHVVTEWTPFDYGYPMTALAGISGYLEAGRAWVEPSASVIGEERPVELPVLVGDLTMRSPDTLFTLPNPKGRLAGMAFEPFIVPPFHDVARDGSGIVLAEWSDARPSELHVLLFAPDAERHSRVLRFPETPVPAHVRDSLVAAGVDAIEALAERLRAQGIPRGEFREIISPDEVRETVYLPAYYPPIRRVLAGLDETIWIERTEALSPGAWVALDVDGNPLFQIRLPEGVTLRQASRDAVWGTERDDFDVPYVVRWNLSEPDD